MPPRSSLSPPPNIQAIATRPGARAIVKAITDLAGAMGMETTAEGVEESDQLAELRGQGCTLVQGFIYSKPIPSQEVATMLDISDFGEQRAA